MKRFYVILVLAIAVALALAVGISKHTGYVLITYPHLLHYESSLWATVVAVFVFGLAIYLIRVLLKWNSFLLAMSLILYSVLTAQLISILRRKAQLLQMFRRSKAHLLTSRRLPEVRISTHRVQALQEVLVIWR